MLKSKMYTVAQLAVLAYEDITNIEKLEIVKELQEKKDIAEYRESKEREDEKNV